MPASLLIAAPDSTTRMRQAADLVIDPAAGDPAQQINTFTKGRRGVCDWAGGTYPVKSLVLRRTALEHRGEGAASRVLAAAGFSGDRLFGVEPAAHYTLLSGFHLDGARLATYAAYSDAGKPDAALPPTSPDSWHRHEHLVISGLTGPAFGSESGTAGTREGWFQDILIIGSAFEWSGSDVWIDNLEVRNNPTPVLISGGNARTGMGGIKVFYSTGVAFKVASSRFIAGVVELQDAGTHGIDISGADCHIGVLRIDSAGRSTPNGDAVLLNGPRAVLPSVQIIDRGANTTRTRNGLVASAAAAGSVVNAVVGPGLTGAAYTGTYTALAGLRVNGRTVVGDAATSGPAVDLAPLTARVDTLEAASANTDTSLVAVDAAIADLDSRTDALEVRASDLTAHATEAVQRFAAIDSTLAADAADLGALRARADLAADHAARLARLEQREQDVAAMLSTLDQAIAAVSTQAPKARDALRVVRGILAKHVGAA